jgi:hypothetical protein
LGRHLDVRAILVQDVDDAPVREARHGKAGDLLERRPVVERRSQDEARLGEEVLELLAAVAVRDVGGDAHVANDLAGGVLDREGAALEPPDIASSRTILKTLGGRSDVTFSHVESTLSTSAGWTRSRNEPGSS